MKRHNNAFIINGKEVAARIRDELKAVVSVMKSDTGRAPGLAVVLVGENQASKVYVRNKARACEEVGIRSFQHSLPENVGQSELLALISELNASDDVHGILVQLPLPGHIDDALILEAISPAKDVDGFHPCNMGRLAIGSPLLSPCTPLGVMKLLDSIGMDISGKEAVIVGRSNIVGKPVALMLLKRNATVSICHSKTTDLQGKVLAADIVIAAIGRERYIKGEWIKDGAIVIDVGINRAKDGTLTGDVDFEGASKHASYITPVPGGVGPMTIAMLLSNTVDAARRLVKK
ncbi:MAG: bifunctional methylenetetrahydrofolate dehydrogenase/methenyltetrahydrofolate cyclohydrolase FolD [Deltaproteobacteria bacterium]|nr:bifunctional methylenetetrahydrofolate dehydrogenase/methenyltetrahydrofolate cyclohydrolase FolD [Deltaproteobacteria bacterium]